MTPLTADQQKLVEDNIAFAKYFANRLRKQYDNVDFDDLYQWCLVGLCRAAQRNKPELGFNFVTLASWTMLSYVSNFAKVERRHRHKLDMLAKMRKGGVENPAESIALLRDDLDVWMRYVPARQREVIKRLYGLDCERVTQQQLGKEYGCKHQMISSLRSRGLAKLKMAARRAA